MLKRVFTPAEISWITSSPRTISGANIEVECPICRQLHKLELSLDLKLSVKPGYALFPDDDLLHCCSKSHDISEIRNQVEWTYGWPEDRLERF